MSSAITPSAAAEPVAPPEPEPLPARSRGRALLHEWLPVGLFYTLLGIALTWPMPRRMSSGIYGFGNDNWGGIWFGKWVHDAFWGPASTGFSREIQFPFGFEFDDRYVAPYDRVFSIALGGIGDGLFAYNAMILIGFPLAGLTMYALARYLTQDRAASLLAGTIFVASPFHLAMAMQYPAMASIFPIPLLVLALIHAFRTRRVRDAALAGAALALVWAVSYYYGWFAIWFVLFAAIGAGVAGLWRAWRAHRVGPALREGVRFTITRGAAMGGAFLLIAVPLLYGLIHKVLTDSDKYARQEADVFENAVRPWQYILPPHDNPVFGGATRDVIARHTGILPLYEQSVYLGAVAVGLALTALILVRRARPVARLAVVPLLMGAGFCALLTLGPAIPLDVLSVGDWLSPGTNPHVTGPSTWLYDLSPNFRYYGRAFVFVSAALASLAAIGFAITRPPLVRRFGARAPWALAAILIALVLVEYANQPPRRFVDLSSPPWLSAVKKLPKNASLIEYPVGDYSSPRSLQYVYWQTRHGRKTVNPPETPQSQAFLRSVDDPDSFLAGRQLSRAGVDFAVVHTKLKSPTFPPYQPATLTDQEPRNAGRANPWLQPYSKTSDAVIYRVLKRPRTNQGAVVGFGAGWDQLEVDKTGRWRWMRNGDSAMSIFSARDEPRAVLAFDVTSFAQPRKMDIAIDGKHIARRTVLPDQILRVRLPVHLRKGAHALQITTDPGPQVVDQLLNNNDLRALAIRIGQQRIILPTEGSR